MNRTLRATTAVALLAVPALVTAPAHAPAAGCPQVVVHRTNPNAAPENTLPGIAGTRGTSSRIVEVDVQWTSSGFPVLMHDTTVDRTTNGSGPASSLGLAQIRGLSAADYAPWKSGQYGGFTGGVPRTPVPYGYEFMDAVVRADLDLLIDVSA